MQETFYSVILLYESSINKILLQEEREKLFIALLLLLYIMNSTYTEVS